MKDFFHGWRRKAGCVALVMALALCGLWIRSQRVADVVAFPLFQRQNQIALIDNRIVWTGFPQHPAYPAWKIELDMFGGDPEAFELALLGLGGHDRPHIWIIRTWLLAIPLTLLSAYLILWNPRKQPSQN